MAPVGQWVQGFEQMVQGFCTIEFGCKLVDSAHAVGQGFQVARPESAGCQPGCHALKVGKLAENGCTALSRFLLVKGPSHGVVP